MNLLANLLSGSNTENITIADYDERFAGSDHVLIDVRTPEEFEEGRMPGAMLIPLGEIGKRTDEIPTGKPVVLVCATGNRSRVAAGQLARAGFEDLYNLRGGTVAWARAGKPIDR
jgi:rhodanese-related sulfurtransferase